ncbi:helix-turn-helix domain-containing protein [Enterococcus diestrammenae]|uniref:HTH cro/C1-type domain-containing protein n=1 Tax=Enterococcus diestrammenae TaxID=1155073 RepID=A0ABV0EZ35_9ENTE|nr:helix-turn-helix transcriptional regulator [Enterococcus diestrammenae]KAF1294778.1 transcriptional regulator [Enterococcus diestrammenae]
MALDLVKIKETRVEKGITQDEMARILGWKTRTPYAKRENGFVDIGADELQKIGEALGYGKDQLGIFFTFNVPERERKMKEEVK